MSLSEGVESISQNSDSKSISLYSQNQDFSVNSGFVNYMYFFYKKSCIIVYKKVQKKSKTPPPPQISICKNKLLSKFK